MFTIVQPHIKIGSFGADSEFFFDNTEGEIWEMSPYNPVIKRLYNINSTMLRDKVDAGRCRLELDIGGIRKIF